MEMGKIPSISFVILFIIGLITPITTSSSFGSMDYLDDYFSPSADAPTNKTYLDAFEAGRDERAYNSELAMNSLMLMSMDFMPNASESTREGHLIVTNTEGDILNALSVPLGAGSPKFINATTVLFSNGATENISLWNIETNKTVDTLAPDGHHEREYNPETDTFMVIETVAFGEYPNETPFANQTINGDDVVEYDRFGNELWRWEGNLTFPFDFDEFYLRNESQHGYIDWMHSNSLYWDLDAGDLYLNVRHLDCVVKIDYETGATEWVVGRYTGNDDGLDLYNVDGEETDALFYHAHACELINPNKFIIYDNDYWNLTRYNPEIGISRYVEFEVNETTGTASETWVWTAPASYYFRAQGNADRLPNGNTVGSFNLFPEPVYTEVDEAGEIVWEWTFNITENIGFRAPPNGFRRFFQSPLVEVNSFSESIVEGTNASFDLSVWDTFKKQYTSNGQILVFEGQLEHFAIDIEILPHWQETVVSFNFGDLVAGTHYLSLLVISEDGVTTTFTVTIEVTPNYLLIVGVVGAVAAVVVVLVVYRVKKSK